MPELREPIPNNSDSVPTPPPDANKPIEALQRRIDRLTVAVVLMALITLLSTAVVFGQLVNWFAGDALLQGGVSIGGALVGFGFGWFAGRRFG